MLAQSGGILVQPSEEVANVYNRTFLLEGALQGGPNCFLHDREENKLQVTHQRCTLLLGLSSRCLCLRFVKFNGQKHFFPCITINMLSEAISAKEFKNIAIDDSVFQRPA